MIKEIRDQLESRRCIIWTVSRACIFKRLWGPGIDSKEWIPPAYVAWRAGYDNPIPPRFLAPIDSLKIPAQQLKGMSMMN
jgi:hypothetical protein